jgi:CheY-like chemotaxis protein
MCHGYRVLIIEDDPEWLDFVGDDVEDAIARLQQDYGQGGNSEIIPKRTFKEARTALNDGTTWHLVILDLHLSPPNSQNREETSGKVPDGPGGMRLARKACSNGIPTVVISGLASPTQVRNLFKIIGIDDFFEKTVYEATIFSDIIAKILFKNDPRINKQSTTANQ